MLGVPGLSNPLAQEPPFFAQETQEKWGARRDVTVFETAALSGSLYLALNAY
jgi:hypothetical protein